MKFTVELLAFGKPGEVREVEVGGPDAWPPKNIIGLKGGHTRSMDKLASNVCGHIFKAGQNEVQPQEHPSVSAGDVIHIGEERWLTLGVGFKKLTPDEYTIYKEMPRDKRMMIPYLSTP